MSTLDTTAPTVTVSGDYTTTRGSKYDRDVRPTQRNAAIRKEIREFLKSEDCLVRNIKVSVAKGHGYSDLSITIIADFESDEVSEIIKTDEYGSQRRLKGAYRVFAEQLKAIAQQYFKIEHSSHTDYYHGGFLFVYMAREDCNGGVIVA